MQEPSSTTLFAALPRRSGAGAVLVLALWAVLSSAFVALEALPVHAEQAARAEVVRAERARDATRTAERAPEPVAARLVLARAAPHRATHRPSTPCAAP